MVKISDKGMCMKQKRIIKKFIKHNKKRKLFLRQFSAALAFWITAANWGKK